MNLLEPLRSRCRSLGFDLVRFPHPGSLAAHLKRLFPKLGIDCVLDVGAHTGEYGRFLREVVGYGGHIVSFEPLLGSFETLARVSERDPDWIAHRLALGDWDGETTLRVTRGTVFSSFLAPSTYARQRFGEGVEIERMETVPVRRLDGALREVLGEEGPSRIFLKIDVQGSERSVVRGAHGCLQRIIALQTESAVRSTYQGAPRLWELMPELEERGFRLTGLFPVSLDRRDLSLVEVDAVAVREDGAIALDGESSQ